MRLLSLLILFAIVVCGCARSKQSNYPIPKTTGFTPAGVAVRPANTNSPLIVTPGQQLTGRLAMVNASARHVIVSFPLGRMPQIDQRLNVYRNGLKVGEIKISGPQRDVLIAADITAGECQVGDEVKAQ